MSEGKLLLFPVGTAQGAAGISDQGRRVDKWVL